MSLSAFKRLNLPVLEADTIEFHANQIKGDTQELALQLEGVLRRHGPARAYRIRPSWKQSSNH
jgi:hypothetical protein